VNFDVLWIVAFTAIAIWTGTFAEIALQKPYVAKFGPFEVDRHARPVQYWLAIALSVIITVAALLVGWARG
jgi:hypothetical protein